VIFKQHEISVLLETREAIMNQPDDPLFYRRTHNLSVGSFWVETVMSSLTPQQIYNSIRFRRGLYIFLNFVMPVLFALQMFGIIRPYLRSFQIVLVTSLQQDWLLRVLRWVLDRHLFTADFLYLNTILETAMLWTGTILERVAEVVQTAEYARLKLKRLGESTQVLTMLGEAAWNVFASIGEVFVSIASLLAQIITSKPLKYCMTVINGMLKTDRFAHVLSANQRFWRYVNHVRRALGVEVTTEATAGEAPPEEDGEDELEEEDEYGAQSEYPSSPEHDEEYILDEVNFPDFDHPPLEAALLGSNLGFSSDL
jgi:hypothetical protein